MSVLTILAQLFLTGRFIERFGVGAAAAVLPASAALGLVALAVSPTLAVIVTITGDGARDRLRPREPGDQGALHGGRQEEKYKAQNFNDTVVFRAGDAASGWMFNSLPRAWASGFGATAAATLPIALAWFGLSLALGRQHAQRADAREPSSRTAR